MKTLEIKKSDAIKAHENSKKTGKTLLEDLFGKKVFQKEVTERIKTFDDVLEELGISTTDFNNANNTLGKDEIAYRKIKLIVKALNEDWTPNWNDTNEYKYHPLFKLSSASGGFSYIGYDYWYSGSNVGSRLCFPTSTLSKYAATQFKDIYKDFLTV